jgi:hypothetical protein
MSTLFVQIFGEAVVRRWLLLWPFALSPQPPSSSSAMQQHSAHVNAVEDAVDCGSPHLPSYPSSASCIPMSSAPTSSSTYATTLTLPLQPPPPLRLPPSTVDSYSAKPIGPLNARRTPIRRQVLSKMSRKSDFTLKTEHV